MNGNVFIDTNLLVYSYSYAEPEKQRIAQQLISGDTSFISTQVLQELANTLTKKFKFTFADAIKAINESRDNSILHINTESTIVQACKVAERYGFSFYDSLIISAALECECVILYSEDMNNSQVIEKKLKIVNPFP
ncbi:MAG: PIN domain-containing protein [Cyclobacteriaceae bacterium]|nr:PIN domain-containing protein [Cyclobacteriaceae bacterium]